MPVSIPDFAAVGFDDPRAAGGLPTFPANDAGAEGMMTLGKGVEKAGLAAADIGALQEYKRQRLNEANATTDLFNRIVPLHAQIATETDPEKLAQLKGQYGSILQTSAQAIDDPLRQRMWIATHSKTIAEANAEADARSTVLYRNSAIASGLTNIQSAVRNGAAADDPNALANAQLAISDNLHWMGEAGALTPEAAQNANKQAQKQLVEGRVLRLTDQGRTAEAKALLEQNYTNLDPITHGNLQLRIEAKGNKIVTDGAALRALGLPTVGAGNQPEGYLPTPPPGGNWETAHNNFGGMRKVGVPAAGPNAGGFQSFNSPEEGVAAISHQLDRYASGATTGAPLTTLRQIVSTWAPPSENDTPALIARASTVTGFAPDQTLDVADPAVKAKLIEATIRNEQAGKLPVDPAVIAKVAGTAAPDQATGAQPQTGAQPIPTGEASAAPPAAPPQGRTGLPSLAETYLNILKDPAIKTDAQQEAAFRTATAVHGAFEAQAAQAERIQAQQAKATLENATNKIYADVYSPHPKITPQQIAVDPAFDSNPDRRKAMIELVNNPPGTGVPAAQSYAAAQSLIDRIRLPYGNADKITTPDEIYANVHNLNRPDLEFALKTLNDSLTPQRENLTQQENRFFAGVRPQIDKSGIMAGLPSDGRGVQKFSEFQRDVSAKVDQYLREKKDPTVLFDPKNPAYAGAPEVLKPYKRTLAEALADYTNDMGADTGGAKGPVSAVEITATGPNGDHIALRQGQWVDMKTGAPLVPAGVTAPLH